MSALNGRVSDSHHARRPGHHEARRLLQQAVRAGLDAFHRNSHKPGWKGLGWGFWSPKCDEEDIEWIVAMAARDKQRAWEEWGDKVWTSAMAMDDLGMLPEDRVHPLHAQLLLSLDLLFKAAAIGAVVGYLLTRKKHGGA